MRGDFPWVETLSEGACFVSRELTTENPSRLAGRAAPLHGTAFSPARSALRETPVQPFISEREESASQLLCKTLTPARPTSQKPLKRRASARHYAGPLMGQYRAQRLAIAPFRPHPLT